MEITDSNGIVVMPQNVLPSQMTTVAEGEPPTDTDALAAVSHILPEVVLATIDWERVRHACAGQQALVRCGSRYVPMLNPCDKSEENIQRNAAYLCRGVYHNFTGRTRAGMIGTIFQKKPIVTLPQEIEAMYEDADGGGVSMDQQIASVLSEVLTVGRVGLLADFPTTDAPITRAQLLNGELRPCIQTYMAEQIINWRMAVVNGKRKLTLVVLQEWYIAFDNGFIRRYKKQWRVLRLEDGAYTVQVYREGQATVEADNKITPTDANGKPFDTIPFIFCGSVNNDPNIDPIPLLDLANLNIGHFRNSCDLEEMIHVLGQPTPVVTGLTEHWVKEVMGGQVALGSTTALTLPVGATADLLQVSESQLAMSAMKMKEEEAVALGARLVQGHYIQRTAKEAGLDDESETSLLMTVAKNVSSAYKNMLRVAAAFVMKSVPKDIGYEINTDFDILRLDTLQRQQLLLEWQAGLMTFSEARSILRRAGVATLDDTEAEKELEAHPAPLGVEPGAPGQKGGDSPDNTTGDNGNGDPVSPLAANKKVKLKKKSKVAPGQIPKK